MKSEGGGAQRVTSDSSERSGALAAGSTGLFLGTVCVRPLRLVGAVLLGLAGMALVRSAGFKAVGRVLKAEGGPVDGLKVVYVRDPDGVVLELIEEPKGVVLEEVYFS